MKKILITGGAGYIGSHTVLELLNNNYEVAVIDDLSNSSPLSLKRVEKLTNKKIDFHKINLCNKKLLEKIFRNNDFHAVIHFAGLKVVNDSIDKPLSYYQNNIISTLNLLENMDKYNIKNLVFSSSANIYGLATKMPITELTPKGPTNPYGETKLMIEKILEDLVKTNNSWNITSLRYFNPVGAHFSGQIGEDPNGTPTNLLPFITQVALGKLNELKIYGNDYNTPDGTCIRDFIHVTDLAKAHIAALKNMNHPNIYKAYNIGTGKGTSILEAVNTFMEATGKNVNYKFSERRDQDIVVSYADATLANSELSWKANLSFKEACRDSWKWQSENPNGYKK